MIDNSTRTYPIELMFSGAGEGLYDFRNAVADALIVWAKARGLASDTIHSLVEEVDRVAKAIDLPDPLPEHCSMRQAIDQ